MTCLPQGHVLGGDPRVSREPRPKSDTLRVREHLVRPITAYRQCLIRYSMRQEQKPAVRPLRQYHTRHECVVAKDRCAPPAEPRGPNSSPVSELPQGMRRQLRASDPGRTVFEKLWVRHQPCRGALGAASRVSPPR